MSSGVKLESPRRVERSHTATPVRNGGAPAWPLPALASISAGLLQYVWIAKSDWWLDDFRNLAEARHEGLTLSFLLRPIFEHFSPGHRFLDWAVVDVFNRDQRAAAVILAACVAGSVWAFWDLLTVCFGRRPAHAVLAWLAGTSWILVSTGQWFAAAAHSFPALLFTSSALAAYARWRRDGRHAWRVVSILGAIAALLFWSQAMLIPFFLLLLDVFVFDRAWPLTRERVAELARNLAVFVAIDAAYLIYVDLHPWHTKFASPSISDTSQFVETMLFRGFLPTIVGTGFSYPPGNTWEQVTQVAAIALVIVGIALAVIKHRAIVRAAAFFLLATAGVAITILVSRVAEDGPQIGNEPRYLTPLPFLFFFAVALALTPARAPGHPAEPRDRTIRRGPLLVVCLAALLGAAYLVNVNATADRRTFATDEATAARKIAANLDAGIARARGAGQLRAFVNTSLPGPIWYDNSLDEDGKLSHTGPFFDPDIDPVGEGDQLLTIDRAGHVVDATFRPLADAQSPLGATIRFDAPPTSAPNNRFVRLTLDDTNGGTLRIVPAVKDALRDVAATTIRYSPGHHQYVLPLWSPTVTEIQIEADRSASIQSAELGTIEATA